tara:strand:+ start:176 stop:490 length:315 start_codon:yes stop_codon:yes gene_type:complete
MKNFKILLIFLLIFISFNSCGAIKEGFSLQKKDNTDEFLVEKKNPLKIPPNYDELPVPNNSEDKVNEGIQDIISNNENVSGDVNTNTQGNTNLEKVLLDKIKNN